MITVYTKDLCGFCHAAKKYLDEKNLEYKEINIDYDPEARAFLKAGGHKTCPQSTTVQTYSSKVVMTDYLHYPKKK